MLAQQLGTGQLVKSDGQYSFDTDVLVVVGRDWQSESPTNQLAQ